MLLTYKNGQTSVVLRAKLLDSSSSTGAGLTGLTSGSSGLIISTIADNEATATAYTQAGSTIESITTLGTFAAPTATKCRFKELDSTNHKGVYEFQFADARFAVSNAKSLLVSVLGATNLQQMDFVVQLQSDDPFVAKPTNSNLLSIDASGRIDAGKWLGGAIPTPNVTGVPIVDDKYLLGTVYSTPATAGIQDINLKNIANAAVSTSTAQLGVNAVNIAGVAASATNLGKTTNAIGRGTVTTGASTTSIPTSAFTPAGAVANQFAGRVVLFDGDTTTAALRGQAAVISASSNSSTPTFTVAALTTAPASGDTFSVI